MDRYSISRLGLAIALFACVGIALSQPSNAQRGLLQPACGCAQAVCGCEVQSSCDVPIEDFFPTDCGCASPLTCGCEVVTDAYQTTEPTCGVGLVPTICDDLNPPGCGFITEPSCGFAGDRNFELLAEPGCGIIADPGCGFEVLGEPLIHAPPIFTEPTCGIFSEPTCGCGRLDCADLDCGNIGVNCDPGCGCGSVQGSANAGGLRAWMRNAGWRNPLAGVNLFSWNRSIVGAPGPRSKYFTLDIGFASIWDDARSIGPISSAVGSQDFELDSGALIRYGIGWDYDQFRVEAEVAFRRSSLDASVGGTGARAGDSVDVWGNRRSTTLMFNGYYDLYNGTFFTPYLKGGLGVSRNKVQANYVANAGSQVSLAALGLNTATRFASVYPERGSTEFAWSLGFGLGTEITDRVRLDLEYQYMDVGNAITGADFTGEALDFGDGGLHEVTMGLRFYH